MTALTEAIGEEAALGWFKKLGNAVCRGADLGPAIPEEAREEALHKLFRFRRSQQQLLMAAAEGEAEVAGLCCQA